MTKANMQTKDYHDLCVTCRHFSTCMYVNSGTRPVHYCEEFEVYAFRPLVENSNPTESNVENEEPVFFGLCKNCGNRLTCMNASPDRIIWHCEEYI